MVKIRRAYEVLFLGLFLFFLVITDLRYLQGWPVSLFLEATPLVAVSTALTTHTLYRNLVWGLLIIAITMMLGRVWCNWMCPFGILHHFFGWIGNRRNTKQAIESNRYRKIYAIKYYILAVMLVMASIWIVPTLLNAPARISEAYREAGLRNEAPTGPASMALAFGPASSLLWGSLLAAGSLVLARLFGLKAPAKLSKIRSDWVVWGLLAVSALSLAYGVVRAGPGRTMDAVQAGLSRSAAEQKQGNSTLQIGLLDPIALTVRSLTTSVLPTVHTATGEQIYTENREYCGPGWSA